MARLEVLQLKVFRNISKLDKPYVTRANTNQVVVNLANLKMEEEGKHKSIISFPYVYKKLERKLACKIITQPSSSLLKVTFKGEGVGKPLMSWAEIALTEIWDILKHSDSRFRFTAFDFTNPAKVTAFKQFSETQT